MKKLVLDKPKQWKVLSSPVRLEVVEILELYGPSSIAEVASRLARTPHSLYHHFRELVEAGIVREDHTRRSGARSEAVYEICGRPIILRYEPDSAESRRMRLKAVRLLLRQTERDYERSVSSILGKEKNQPEARRYRAPLRPSSVKKIQRHMDAIVRTILEERVDPSRQGKGANWFSWTGILAPLGRPESRAD